MSNAAARNVVSLCDTRQKKLMGQFGKLSVDGWKVAEEMDANRRIDIRETYRGALADLCMAMDSSDDKSVTMNSRHWAARWRWKNTEVVRFLELLMKKAKWIRFHKQVGQGYRITAPCYACVQSGVQSGVQKSEDSSGKDGHDVYSLVYSPVYINPDYQTIREEEESPLRVPPPGTGTPSARHTSKSRGTRLPEDWECPSGLFRWACEVEGLSVEAVNRGAQKFRDYWIGNGKTRVNCAATWRNWISRAREQACFGGGRAMSVRDRQYLEREAMAAELNRRRMEGTDAVSIVRSGGQGGVRQLDSPIPGPEDRQ